LIRLIGARRFLTLCCLFALSKAALASDSWVTLGTSGGPSVHAYAAQIANALVVHDQVYLFDVGDGVRGQMVKAGLQGKRLRAIFLRHHHIDHNADLGPLMINNWIFNHANRLAIIGPQGVKSLVNGLVAANAPTVLASFPTIGPAKPSLMDTLHTIEPEFLSQLSVVYQDENIKVSAVNVEHFQVAPSIDIPVQSRALGFKIETSHRTIVYTGDTGFSGRLIDLADNADVLISEVVDVAAIEALLYHAMPQAPDEVLKNLVDGLSKNHLQATTVGDISRKAKVKKVVLTHFVPLPVT